MVSILPVVVVAQSDSEVAPWFGIALPPALIPHSSPVAIGSRGPAPAVVPEGEEEYFELEGRRLGYDLERIVDFSRQSRLNQEFGSDQLWGSGQRFFIPVKPRCAGQRERLLDAGIEDVRFQRFNQEPDARLWLPQQWELRLLANSQFGGG